MSSEFRARVLLLISLEAQVFTTAGRLASLAGGHWRPDYLGAICCANISHLRRLCLINLRMINLRIDKSFPYVTPASLEPSEGSHILAHTYIY